MQLQNLVSARKRVNQFSVAGVATPANFAAINYSNLRRSRLGVPPPHDEGAGNRAKQGEDENGHHDADLKGGKPEGQSLDHGEIT